MAETAKNIRILGGGPSGMTAAIALRAAGIPVTVFERKSRPGERFCNGWQILENYTEKTDTIQTLKSWGISPDFFHRAATDIEFLDYRLNRYGFSGAEPFGYFVKRGSDPDSLDSALHDQASAAGVDIRYNSRIFGKDADIVAGGAPQASGISKEVVFDSDSPDMLLTILDDYLTPKGFSYLFIINGRGTIGTAILRDFRHINDYSESVVLRFKQAADFSMRNIRESVSSVGFFLPSTAAADGKRYIGESAGFQDYLFGLGIRRSIQSGYLAAQSIISGTPYDQLWRAAFGKSLDAGILNRFLFERAGNRGYSLLMKAAKRMDFRSVGFRLHNPSVFRLAVSRLVRTCWRSPHPEKRNSRCIWYMDRQ